jgi:hypothetical protein
MRERMCRSHWPRSSTKADPVLDVAFDTFKIDRPEFGHGTVCDSSEAVKHHLTRQRRLHPESDAGRLVIGIRCGLSGGADDRLSGREPPRAS